MAIQEIWKPFVKMFEMHESADEKRNNLDKNLIW